jgi:hypothetical protein
MSCRALAWLTCRFFPSPLAAKAPPLHGGPAFPVRPFCPWCPHLRHADCAAATAVTMAEVPFARVPMVDRILQSRSLASSTPSAIGFQMTDFRRKPFSQEAGCDPPVLFGTAALSGLYPFATARSHDRNRFLRRVSAMTSGFAVYDAICRDDRCDELAQGNNSMQFDAGHLTAEGAIEVGRRLSAAFARKHARAADVSH